MPKQRFLSCLSSGFLAIGSCRVSLLASGLVVLSSAFLAMGKFLSANARRHVYITKIKKCMGQHATFLLAGVIRLQNVRASVHSKSLAKFMHVKLFLESLGGDEDNLMTEEIMGWIGTRRHPDPNQCSC